MIPPFHKVVLNQIQPKNKNNKYQNELMKTWNKEVQSESLEWTMQRLGTGEQSQREKIMMIVMKCSRLAGIRCDVYGKLPLPPEDTR